MMHLKGCNRMLLPSIFLAFLYCVSAVDDLTEYRCPFTIHVKKGQIIKAKESMQNGAKFLKHTVVADARECYKLCCERESCDLALMQYANSSNPTNYLPVEKVCYMFHCGKPTKCRFGEHKHYATISYVRPNEQLLSLDGNPSQNAKSTYRPSDTEGSDKDEEEEDLGYKSYQPHSRQKTQEIQQNKNLHSSWKTKFEGTNSGYSNKEFGKSIYHSKTANKPATTTNFKEHEQPVYQEVHKQPENPTKLVEVKTKIKASVLPFERIPLEQNKPKVSVGSDEGDADLEVKVEELTPSKKPVRPLPTFHHWREFVDNNPNFPYTIPLNYDRNTQKPTRKKWFEAPRTEHPTRRKITTRKVVKTDPIKTTEKTTTEKLTTTTEKIKTTEKARIQEKNNLPGQGAKPPILQLPLPKQNVSDVVVIETQRLRIIENKAVLPLAIFLVLAIVLLFVVALRLRIVKSKLKRRPFATDDADYLINGMYL